MTKEELKKEAKRSCIDKSHYCIGGFGGDAYCEGYLVGAEPREKRIAELEKENAKLKNQLFTLRNERNTFLAQNEQYEKDLIDFNENLTKAKEIIQELVHEISVFYIATDRIVISPTVKQAEQFLKETENGK